TRRGAAQMVHLVPVGYRPDVQLIREAVRPYQSTAEAEPSVTLRRRTRPQHAPSSGGGEAHLLPEPRLGMRFPHAARRWVPVTNSPPLAIGLPITRFFPSLSQSKTPRRCRNVENTFSSHWTGCRAQPSGRTWRAAPPAISGTSTEIGRASSRERLRCRMYPTFK